MNNAYLEVISLVERLHRHFLEVVKLELEGLGIHDINNVQGMMLFNIGEAEMTVGELTPEDDDELQRWTAADPSRGSSPGGDGSYIAAAGFHRLARQALDPRSADAKGHQIAGQPERNAPAPCRDAAPSRAQRGRSPNRRRYAPPARAFLDTRRRFGAKTAAIRRLILRFGACPRIGAENLSRWALQRLGPYQFLSRIGLLAPPEAG